MQDLLQFIESLSPIKEISRTELVNIFHADQLQKGDLFTVEGNTSHNFAFLRSGVVRAFYRKEWDGIQ